MSSYTPRLLDPLRLSAPPNFGSAGDLRVPGNYDFAYQMGQAPEIEPPLPPERMQQQTQFPQGPGVPDMLRVHYGAGDKNIVGDLLRIVSGQEPQQLSGVDPALAQKYLTKWGYPARMNDWSPDQWAAAIDGHALDFNPLTLFNIGYPSDGSYQQQR